MIKEKDIKQLAEDSNIAYKDNSTIVGVVFPSKLTYTKGPIASALSMKYFVINFNDEGIFLVILNNMTGKLEEDSLLFVKKEEITSVNFKKGLLNYSLMIETKNGNLPFKVNKLMFGAGWHKENLQKVIASF